MFSDVIGNEVGIGILIIHFRGGGHNYRLIISLVFIIETNLESKTTFQPRSPQFVALFY